jgi:quercetin dioxygenase-like cupin family protein
VNTEVYQLEAGDSLLFEAAQPHCFHNAAESQVTLIMVFQVAEGSQLAGYQHIDK